MHLLLKNRQNSKYGVKFLKNMNLQKKSKIKKPKDLSFLVISNFQIVELSFTRHFWPNTINMSIL